MKKERIISLMLALTATAMTAQADVAIDAKNFPDERFRSIVAGSDIDKDADGYLSDEEIAAVTELDVHWEPIYDLTGVEHFTALTSLDCSYTGLSALDVSKNTELTSLDCSINYLSALDVSKNTALTTLLCYDNQLTSLDLSNNKALTVLSCYLNQIGHSDMLKLVNSLPTVTNGNFCGISISSSTEKNVLAKSRVEIAQGKGWSVKAKDGSSTVDYEGSEDPGIIIDATNFPDENFRTVVAGTDIDTNSDGKLSEEEIAAVTWLDVNEKNIASLKGIEFFTALTELHCGATHLTSLNVSKNTALTFLDCSLNQLTSLDVSKNTALTQLDCSGNQLTSLDVSKNTALQLLGCLNNQIKGDQMQALVNSLPTVTGGEFWVIDTKSSNEQNVCTEPQVKIATGKGWTVCDYNGGTPEVLGQIAIDATNFPDENFRAIVAGTDIDKDANGYLSDEEIAAVTELTVSHKNIASLKGIEFFTALKKLYCRDNQLTSLDVSKNTALTALGCEENQLTSLDVSKNTALQYLGCWNIQLTSLDVSKNTALTKLYCENNQLTSLDVSKNTALEYLNCENNQLTSLDVSKNTALLYLACHDNKLTSLDVSKNTALQVLECYNNQLTSLDVSKNTALIILYCWNNQLTGLDVSKNTALEELYCYENQLTSLDVSKNTALEDLYCYGNQLTSLDVSKNTALTFLACFNNQIKEDQMQTLVNSLPTVTNRKFYVIDTKNSNEQNVCTKDQVAIAKGKGWTVYDNNGGSRQEYAGSGESGIAIDATNFPDETFRAVVAETKIDKDADGYLSDEEIAAVTQLTVFSLNIASLKGIEFFTALTQLDCSNNQLTSLDVSKNTALTELECYNNQLTSLDVSKNTALTRLDCSSNQLKSLDVSKNTALQFLDCENNQLTSLDVSKNTALIGLYCPGNQLASLDVSKNTALKDLWCYGNQLTSLDVSKNTALTQLVCFGNQIKGEQMQALANSLPTVTNGKFCVIDTKNSNEQNVCTKEQVAIATGKGWMVYDWNGGTPEVLGQIAINATNFPDENFCNFVAGSDIDKDADGYLSDEEIAAVTQLDVREMGIQDLKGIEFFTGLKELLCWGNELTSLDVSKNTELTRLACGQNQIKSLDLSKNTKMENLHCANNQLTALDVSMMPNLWRLYCLNNKLTKLDVTKNTKLTELTCSENQLTSLDVSKNTALEKLYCDNNQLTSLDVSKNTALIDLYCNDNQLTSLDVSKNTALEYLHFENNQLSSIDLSKNTALIDLRCENNQLTSLDVSKNTALRFLYCHGNQIKEDQMLSLVNSLPTVTNGKFYVIDTSSSNEQNVCTKPQVKIATDKGWKVYEYYNGYYYEYEGSVVTAIRSIEVSAEENGLWYTLDGRKLSSKPAQKGIYVRNGRKVVVK